MYIFYRASALFSSNSLYLNRLFSKKLSGAIFKKDYYKGQTERLFPKKLSEPIFKKAYYKKQTTLSTTIDNYFSYTEQNDGTSYELGQFNPNQQPCTFSAGILKGKALKRFF